MIYKITYSNGDYEFVVDNTMLSALKQKQAIAVEQERDAVKKTIILEYMDKDDVAWALYMGL